MGNNHSNKYINDFSKLTIPDTFSIIKLISYDINLYNSIAMRDNIYEIIKSVSILYIMAR